MTARNLYQLLEIPPNADGKTIKEAYRRLARLYHPDMRPNDPLAAARFREISAAYKVLSDETRRAKYDGWLMRHLHRFPEFSQNQHAEAWRAAARQARELNPPHRLPARALFLAFGFVMVAMILQVIVILEYTPRPDRDAYTTQQAIARGTESVYAATATARGPLPTPAGVRLERRAISPAEVGAVPAGAATTSCQLDFVRRTETCSGLRGMRLLTRSRDNSWVVNLVLDPQTSGYSRALFKITYGSSPQGWTVNIGDSESNDGEGGDDGDQLNNAELQIRDNELVIYGSDLTPRNLRPLAVVPAAARANQTITLEIAPQRVRWTDGTRAEEIQSRYLFALQGESDRDDYGRAAPNYEIFAAFNRVIDSRSARAGSGVLSVTITLLPPAEN